MMSKNMYCLEIKRNLEEYSDLFRVDETPELQEKYALPGKPLFSDAIEEPDYMDCGDSDLLFEAARLYEKIISGLVAGGMCTHDAEELIARYEATVIEDFFDVNGGNQQCGMMN